MITFLQYVADHFDLDDAAARTLTGGLLWLMDLGGAADFLRLQRVLPEVMPLMDAAPAQLAVASAPDTFFFHLGGARLGGGGSSLLRLFDAHGLGLQRAARFTQSLLGWLATEVGVPLIRRLATRTPVVVLLLTHSELSRPPAAFLPETGLGAPML